MYSISASVYLLRVLCPNPKMVLPLALTYSLTFHISAGLEQWFHLHCQLAVILVPAPASAPVQQYGSSVQGAAQTKGLGQREGLLSCDAVITEARVSLLCWMDGAMFCPDRG